MDSRTLIALLKASGWEHKNTEGSHYFLIHPSKAGKITVKHPDKDVSPKVLRDAEKLSGLKLRR